MEGKKITKEMNHPRWVPRLGLSFLAPFLVLAISVLIGFFYSAVAGVLVFFGALLALRRMNQADRRFMDLWLFRLGTHYDPALWEDLDDFPSAD